MSSNPTTSNGGALTADQVRAYLLTQGYDDVAAALDARTNGTSDKPTVVVSATSGDAEERPASDCNAAANDDNSSSDENVANAPSSATAAGAGKPGTGTAPGLKAPLPQLMASPTPTKPMELNKSRIPTLDEEARAMATAPTSSSSAAAAAATVADGEDPIEDWDPRDSGVISVPGAEADLWTLDPHTNLAPAFPAGGCLPYKAYMKQCEARPTPIMAASQPYQKRPPPADLPLESFDLRIIYEAGKTGFEDAKDFPIHAGNVIAGRYQVTEYLGSAAFSRAVQCIDLKHNAQVCVKIIRNSKDFFDQALDEVKLLLHINSSGDADDKCVLQLYDYFYYKEHVFLVCELLRDNLYEFAKFNREHEADPYFTLDRVRKVAKQVLKSLAYIHSLNLLHCDLKPENILIKSYSRCIIKVIDFGSSCFKTDSLSSYIQSRCYRAPEVVLGCPYDGGIDVWSLGAILPELMTGHVLFHNDTLAQMLARIAAICGPFPESMLHSGRHSSCFVTAHGAVYEYPTTEVDGHKVEGPLTFHFPRPTHLERLAGSSDPLYLDFLRQTLTVDPTKRPTAAQLLDHPFIQADVEEDAAGASGSPLSGSQRPGGAPAAAPVAAVETS